MSTVQRDDHHDDGRLGHRRDRGDHHDEELLRRLGAVLDVADPVPESVLDAARAAFAARRLDEELAELVADSAADLVVGAPARALAPTTRLLTFETADSGLEVQVTVEGATRHLLGQVLGGTKGPVVLETRSGEQRLEVDGLGRFRAQHISAGEVRLRYRPSTGSPVATGWVRI